MADGHERTRWDVLICLLLAAATVAVFGQVLGQDFVNYDDQIYVYENDAVRAGLSPANLKWAFAEPHIGHYHPLTWVSYMLDVSLFGVRPGPIKGTNLLLHFANTLLLFLALRRMTGACWRSAVVAALFAVHPLHVEPVAWIASRKDVLSGFFFMLTLLAYACYAERPGAKRYAAVLVCFALGLLSKPMVMTLPFVLLLLDYWPLRRLGDEAGEGITPEGCWRAVREKLPLFVLTGFSFAATYYAGKVHNVFPAQELYPLHVRLPNAVVSYARHLVQTLWPQHLAVHYPHPGSDLPVWQLAAAVILLAGITVLALRYWRACPCLPVGWLWYVGMLVPVIGIVQFGGHASADRYTYLPLIGVFVMVAWGVPQVARRWHGASKPLAGLAVVWIVVLMLCAWFQVGHWQDSESLCRHALRATTNNVRMHNNLGNALRDAGRIDEAITEFSAAANVPGPFQLNPHMNLGTLLLEQGNPDAAAAHLGLVLQHDPGCEPAHYFLGKTLASQGRSADAAAQYTQALILSPQNPETRQALETLLGGGEPNWTAAHNALGRAYFDSGRLEQALRHYNEALQLSPEDPETHNNLAVACLATEQFEAAAAHLERVVAAQPGNADALTNLGSLHAMAGRTAEAIARFEAALRSAPEHVTAHSNLARALAEQGRFAEAAEHYEAVLRIEPGHEDARAGLGRVRATAP